MLAGPLRFGELRERIPRITDAMLSQRLKELEHAEVVERTVTVARPVEVRYGLTEIGYRLRPVLDAVRAWSVDWSAHQAARSTD
ncbi:helix-turn-helix transcriptional regulator [Frankia sp. Ag45/Mut15]|uniref:Helix-turn-helix transcriptional regulator n=1 Tax=Frankia umida TaxID=573489 RepID=A0ABT0K4L4_9ACTN|nr:helix-turn-helix domain-containing protein [Frankia umida]MCK9878698.1 helix-turn-helix transcriptional regulator [Frankia umida]